MNRLSRNLGVLTIALWTIFFGEPAFAGPSGTITGASFPTMATAGKPFEIVFAGSGTCWLDVTILDSKGVAVAPTVTSVGNVPGTLELVVEQPGTYQVRVAGTPNKQTACTGQTTVSLFVAPGLYSAIRLAAPSRPTFAAGEADCEKHFPSPAPCQPTNPPSPLRNIVWSFSANTCGAAPNCLAPTSYEVLMHDTSYGIFEHFQTVDADQTGIRFPPALTSHPVCFEVRAISGKEVGPVSDPFCTSDK
jgi:hypothetical protein